MPPVGVYPLRIADAEEKTSKGGNVMFEVDVEIVAGTHHGIKFRDWIMLSGKAAGWHKKKLEQLLCRDLDDGDEILPMDIQGAEFWGYIKHNEYEGKDGTAKVGLQIDAKCGPYECGYSPKALFPWPAGQDWTPPGVVAGAPDEPTNDPRDYDFEGIPF
jgi:hypothetical protein